MSFDISNIVLGVVFSGAVVGVGAMATDNADAEDFNIFGQFSLAAAITASAFTMSKKINVAFGHANQTKQTVEIAVSKLVEVAQQATKAAATAAEVLKRTEDVAGSLRVTELALNQLEARILDLERLARQQAGTERRSRTQSGTWIPAGS